ncbi:transcriptional regulator [Pseudomonas violetae]|uniref:Helix-turn-helix domain-containing protein n=1 Tax=Pseudomonas violetae TaxID=2915813 RepID=A0ABT0F177_9PSED|nr:transcriptional regulator [Pseudomonas violetae]MCK1791762.1 helix-turn-helix domain-containing protein [Pseudomonas violetae]
MSLKKEVAGAIRAIRTTRGLDYGDLAEVSVKANIGKLEQGNSSITLEKLIELSEALQFDPVALLAICLAIHKEEPYALTLTRARDQLDAFEAEGGVELLRRQLVGNELVKRPRGKPGNTQGADSVKALKDAGLSQAEVAERLGLAKSTIHRYWHS